MEFIGYEPGTLDTTFESVSHGQLVLVSGMRVWSLCEHHLLPFWCDVTVAYIAAGGCWASSLPASRTRRRTGCNSRSN